MKETLTHRGVEITLESKGGITAMHFFYNNEPRCMSATGEANDYLIELAKKAIDELIDGK